MIHTIRRRGWNPASCNQKLWNWKPVEVRRRLADGLERRLGPVGCVEAKKQEAGDGRADEQFRATKSLCFSLAFALLLADLILLFP